MPGAATMQVDMMDAYGDGWTFNNFIITNKDTGVVDFSIHSASAAITVAACIDPGAIVDNAYDSLCYGEDGSKSYCLPQGCYNFDVNYGYFPNEIQWQFCGVQVKEIILLNN